MTELTVADLPLSDVRETMLVSLSTGRDIRWASVHSIAWMIHRGLIEKTGPLQHEITELGTVVLKVCQEHTYNARSTNLGGSPIAGGGQQHGVRLDCRCRWTTRTNESGTKGGRTEVKQRHRGHVFAALTEALEAAA